LIFAREKDEIDYRSGNSNKKLINGGSCIWW